MKIIFKVVCECRYFDQSKENYVCWKINKKKTSKWDKNIPKKATFNQNVFYF